ncbi:MAG TPA: NAD(P)/FAD-dependent oxidoreductase [Dehalococcoidia bacterium]|nr:NAD(P)/FAD-dependent oxidoreductase [Dehalococcoidia bacterium]
MPSSSHPHIDDLIIIGAGPTGLFAAFYAGLRHMKTKLVEALPEPGGQLAVLYPEKFIYDVPGHPKVLAKDLVALLMEQIALFNPEMVFDTRIDTCTRASVDGEEVWRLGTATEAHYCRTVLITAGIGAFEVNRLDRPGVEEYEGRGVYYFVKDKRPFRNKRVLIIGGGDTAVDWALNLNHWASHITLIHRRDQFRAHEASLAELRLSEISVMTHWELKRVYGDSGSITGATIYENRIGEERDLDVDIVLINIGFKAALGPIASWGLEMVDARHIRTNGHMETNLPGVYAAGDIAAVEGSTPLNLIVTGFGQAAIAANAARAYIDPKARMFPGHSSEMRLS